jgi:DNA invertase Pin-like site-specific DNA recombinase
VNPTISVVRKSVSKVTGVFVRKVGYARVSAQHQNLDRQLGALVAEGCERVFKEKASGRSTTGRPELEKAIAAVGTGDVLVLPEWDRATRSMLDGIQIIERVAARGALVKVLDKPYLDLTSTMGQGILAFLSALAQDERGRIVKRAQDGRKAAKARGVQFGRKPKLTQHQQTEGRRRLENGESARSIARDFNCHHAIVARLRLA